MKKNPLNCPFCKAEEKGYSSGWSFSFEGWEKVREKHLKEHCEKCPTCGQPISSQKLLEQLEEF